MIRFATYGGEYFPAISAHAGNCDHLADGDEVVFTEGNQTINLRVEVFVPFVVPDYPLIQPLRL